VIEANIQPDPAIEEFEQKTAESIPVFLLLNIADSDRPMGLVLCWKVAYRYFRLGMIKYAIDSVHDARNQKQLDWLAAGELQTVTFV
jgi:hypothetical protein